MTEKKDTGSAPGVDATGWAGMLAGFWKPMMASWDNMSSADSPPEASEAKGRLSASMAATAKMWQALFGALSEPAALENFQKATQLAPDIVMGITQTLMQGLITFQTQVNAWVLKRGADTADFDAQAFDQELINRWSSIYENELRQYLKVPQIGLGRVYQERVMHAVDELNRFQVELSGFMNLLYLPMEKSFKTMQAKMAQMTEAGRLDEKSKTYYNLWIKVLEGHYMELYKTEAFSDAVGDTLTALNNFIEARNVVVNDVLKTYKIPTHKDLDDLYKEVYLLKKRIRACEKQ